jgi:hypothetical protein
MCGSYLSLKKDSVDKSALSRFIALKLSLHKWVALVRFKKVWREVILVGLDEMIEVGARWCKEKGSCWNPSFTQTSFIFDQIVF